MKATCVCVKTTKMKLLPPVSECESIKNSVVLRTVQIQT